eukprot:11314027-Alexandrium_andersonii.AAC.1
MSASLVGSEMCIRDRLSGRARAHPHSCARTGSTCASAPSAPPARSVPAPCLLYTSDAADDM